ncbi:MAG: hypothetical protein NXI31_10060 [bacterium]|nr:hypothetical protein [bacterium]
MTENRPGEAMERSEPDRTPFQRRVLVVPFAFAVFSLSALVYYHFNRDSIAVESPLQVFYAAIYRTFGLGPSVIFFLLLLVWTSIWFFTGRIERPWGRLLRLGATMVMLGIFLNVGESAEAAPHQGELGAFFATRMVAAFGYYPSIVLTFIAALGALFLATDFLFSETFERLSRRPGAAEAGPAPRAGAAADEGVEVEVTDHLKGLASATGTVAQAPAAVQTAVPAVDLAVADIAAADAVEAADAPAVHVAEVRDVPEPVAAEDGIAETYEFREVDDAPEVEPAVEDVPAEALPPRRRRRSYFERRFEEVRQSGEASVSSAAGDNDDPWVPSAGDSQEIDNPESAAEVRTPAMPDAGVEASGIPDSGIPGPGIEDSEIGDSAVDEPGDAEVPAADDLAAAVAAIEAADAAATANEETLFAIPRPEPEPESPSEASQAAAESDREADAAAEAVIPARSPDADAASRQQPLFGSAVDEELVDEARQVVLETRRATATFLRRRLRIGYDEACDVLAELSARGVVELGDDASQGRVIDPDA